MLKPDEQNALALKNLEKKSSWQAGEILNKSHYKYLEISTRAQKFFELFNQHYNLYETLVPYGVTLQPDFHKYLELTIEQRLKVGEAIKLIDNEAYKLNKTRDPLITEGILALKKSKSLHEQNLYNAIMEFDRYNNFRVLPREVQEPSGFKRRNKTRYKKHLMISVTLHPYTLKRIKDIFEQNSNNLRKQNEGYVALTHHPHTQSIIRININKEVITRFSKLSLYVFKRKEKCQEYIDLVFDYLDQEDKGPAKGLIFWPNYRNLIREAINYDELNNIAPSRTNLIQAVNDMDLYYKKKKNIANSKTAYK